LQISEGATFLVQAAKDCL